MIDDVLPFVEENLDFEPDIYIQSSSMNEQQREEFLNNFKENPTKTTLGFVLWAVYSVRELI